MELIDMPMKVQYVYGDDNRVINAGPTQFDQEWYDEWLDSMVKSGDDVVFFLVTETTDVFEKEWDFNEVAVSPLSQPPKNFLYSGGYADPIVTLPEVSET